MRENLKPPHIAPLVPAASQKLRRAREILLSILRVTRSAVVIKGGGHLLAVYKFMLSALTYLLT